VLGQFLAEVVIKTKGEKVRANILFSRYKSWAERSNEYAMSQKNFSDALEDREYHKTRVHEGIYYLDIELAPNTW